MFLALRQLKGLMASAYQIPLLDYLNNNEKPVGNDGILPFRLISQTMKEEELEAGCYDLVITHLSSSSFPIILSLAIAHQVVEETLAQDLSAAIKQNDLESKTYETLQIAQVLFSLIHSLCQKWSEALPKHVLSQPHPPKYSQYGIKNTRRKMEDRHSVIPNLNLLLGLKNCPTLQWYAVYDGHGGLDSSMYSSKQLHLNFARQDDFLSDVPQALKSSILKTDHDFCTKAKHEHLRSGSTAAIAVIVESTLHIAWLGDSQVLLVKDGKPLMIMNPHKPERADEKQRIEEMGGCVVWFGAWRVNGTLSVSRAIGDADHKPFISGDADTHSVPLEGDEDFVCLACDGFWDVLNGDDLVRLVREHFREGGDHSNVSEFLCLKAKSEGSSDNITVVVVFLRDDINMGDEEGTDEGAATNDVQDSNQQTAAGKNTNNNNVGKPTASSDTPADDFIPVQGQQLDLAYKQPIPHKLLLNFIRKTRQRKLEQGTVLVTHSYPHAKLPHSLRNPKLENLQQPSTFQRRSTKDSLLSLATVESITQLPQSKPKRGLESHSPVELPSLYNVDNKKISRRSSLAAPSSVDTRKPLGYRAPNIQNRGRTRVPYRTSIVAPCQKGHSRSTSPRRAYTRSLPEELENNENKMKIAITNSLAPSLKPRHRISQNRQVARLVRRGRRRSRSAF